jgi:phospholipase/carboxylesterase
MSSRLPGQKQHPRTARGRRRGCVQTPAPSAAPEASAWLADDRLFTPLGYEPGYDYPLLVWLPDDGESGRRRFDLGRIMTRVSLRNFVAIQPTRSPQDPPGQADEEFVFRSIDRVCERFSIHRRRIFLVGGGAGGSEAFRIACRNPGAFAGVVSLGGPFPLDEGLFARIAAVRRLPMLLCCRQGDATDARATHVDRTLRLFHAAGASLAMRIYPGRDDLAGRVLADVNRWIMDEVCGSPSGVHSLSAS